MAAKNKARTWYGTIYEWRAPNIKVSLSPKHTVPRTMIDDIDFKMNRAIGVVCYDPDELVSTTFREGSLAVLNLLTVMKFDEVPEPAVLYTTEILVKRPEFPGILLKSGSLQMLIPRLQIQCEEFQEFMKAALNR